MPPDRPGDPFHGIARLAMPIKFRTVKFTQNFIATLSRNVQYPQTTPHGDPEQTIFAKVGLQCCLGPVRLYISPHANVTVGWRSGWVVVS